MTVEGLCQAWASDITYLPMPKGTMYLTVVMDWHSRCILSWELSHSPDGEFCARVLETALQAPEGPQVFLQPSRRRDGPPWAGAKRQQPVPNRARAAPVRLRLHQHYNTDRPRQALGHKPPWEIHIRGLDGHAIRKPT